MASYCTECGCPAGVHVKSCGAKQTERETNRVRETLERARASGRDDLGSIADYEPQVDYKFGPNSEQSNRAEGAAPRQSAFEFWRGQRDLIGQHTRVLRQQVEDSEAVERRIEEMLSLLAAAEGASR